METESLPTNTAPETKAQNGLEEETNVLTNALDTKLAMSDGNLSASLKMYYDAIFPFEALEQWLRYGNDPSSKRPDIDRTFFARREFSFTLENDAYLRFQYCLDWKELREKVLKFKPQKIDIGAVYFASPKSSNFGFNDDGEENLMQTPVEREFVIDIDMDEYNNIRTCCQDTNICKKCWKFLSEGANIIDRTLQDVFGFHHIIWLFSGRRGVHAWVCDKRAREMNNLTRASVAEYLRVVTGNEKTEIKLENHTYPLHPHLKMSYALLKKKFFEVIVKDQRLFENQAHVDQVVEFLRQRLGLEDGAARNIRRIFRNSQSPDFYQQLENEIADLVEQKEKAEKKQKKKTEYSLMEEIVLYYMYPRIDINVSKGMNHLLKSPFCVHPKSKKVSIPIISFQDFDPDTVPTIYDLITMREDGNLLVNKEPIMPYIDYFRRFVEQLDKITKQQQNSDRKENRREQAKNMEF